MVIDEVQGGDSCDGDWLREFILNHNTAWDALEEAAEEQRRHSPLHVSFLPDKLPDRPEGSR